MYVYICEKCGAHLDAGERCECQSKKENNFEALDREEQMALITDNLLAMSDKNLKIVKSFVKGLVAREILERE